MKYKLTLIVAFFVLALAPLALAASNWHSAEKTAAVETVVAPYSCSGQCIINRNACNTACNGNSECLAQCQAEYECCLLACHNQSCRQAAKPKGNPGRR